MSREFLLLALGLQLCSVVALTLSALRNHRKALLAEGNHLRHTPSKPERDT